MDKSDPYAELSAAMQKLEAQGVPEADIIDAAFRLAVTAAARLYGVGSGYVRKVVTSRETPKHGMPSSKVHLSGHRSPRSILLKTQDSLATTGGTISGHLCELSTVRWSWKPLEDGR
jgi:hypothetical protein